MIKIAEDLKCYHCGEQCEGQSVKIDEIALTFAVTGHLTPLIAAILMPISSISVVGFSTIAVNRMATKKLKTS